MLLSQAYEPPFGVLQYRLHYIIGSVQRTWFWEARESDYSLVMIRMVAVTAVINTSILIPLKVCFFAVSLDGNVYHQGDYDY